MNGVLEPWRQTSKAPKLKNGFMENKKLRLIIGMSCYGVLILAALYLLLPARTSNEKFILFVVLAVFALLITKTLAHSDPDE